MCFIFTGETRVVRLIVFTYILILMSIFLENSTMKLIVILLSIVVVCVHSWTLDYAGAKQISSPHFNRGRQGQAITCKDIFSFIIHIFNYFDMN